MSDLDDFTVIPASPVAVQARPQPDAAGADFALDLSPAENAPDPSPAADDFSLDPAAGDQAIPVYMPSGDDFSLDAVPVYMPSGGAWARPQPSDDLSSPDEDPATTYWADLDAAVFRVGALAQDKPPSRNSPWNDVVAANVALMRAIRRRDDQDAVDAALRELLDALQRVTVTSDADAGELRATRAQLCALIGGAVPADLCTDDTGALDALASRVLNYLASKKFDDYTTDGRTVAQWRAAYNTAVGSHGKSRVIADLRAHMWRVYDGLKAQAFVFPQWLPDSGVVDGLAILCAGAADARCREIDTASVPVYIPDEGTVDLNAMAADKCTGAARWDGSVLCNLYRGGALGRLIASVRLAKAAPGPYTSASVVSTLMASLSGLNAQLDSLASYPGAGRALNAIPVVRRFREVYAALERKVAAGERVSLDDFEPVAATVVAFLENTAVRKAVTIPADLVNVRLLDY